MWRHVGRILEDARNERDWTVRATAKTAGIDSKTVKSIEDGAPGNVDKLERHAEALGFTVVDVLVMALERATSPLNREASQMLRHFGRISKRARQALLLAAKAYPDAAEEESPREHR